MTTRYVEDNLLQYDKFSWRLGNEKILRFDDSYRMAHLPLISPKHSLCINQVNNFDYAYGSYGKPRYSLIVPIDFETLKSSSAFTSCDTRLRDCSFAKKIDWNLVTKRKNKVHITIASGLLSDEANKILTTAARFVLSTGAIYFQVKGPYVGSKNTGRIYFPVYPENKNGKDVFASIQKAIGFPLTRFYAIGYYNLCDELDEVETTELRYFLNDWCDEILIQSCVKSFDILETHDDLVLNSKVIAREVVSE